MKINRIYLVGIFILAIITLGAVSAVEEAGNLTVSDDAGDLIEAPVEEMDIMAVEENSGSDVIGDGSEVPMNISIPDDIYYDSYFSASVSVPENATGYVSLYIDGDYQNWEDNWDGKYFFECYIHEFGEHLFEAKYTAGENDIYSNTIKEQTYFLNNTQYLINLFDSVYGENIIPFSAPQDIVSDVVITFKGNKYHSIYNDEYERWVFEVPDLEFGYNKIGVYYPGDEDFAEFSDNQTVECIGRIMSNFTSDESIDILLTLPDNATGRLTVYSRVEGYDDYDNWFVSDVEIGSADMKDGKAVVSITDLSTGENRIYANFTGNYEVEYLYETVTIEPK